MTISYVNICQKTVKKRTGLSDRSGTFFTLLKDQASSILTTWRLLYVPQALQTRCGIVRAPHLLHLTRFGTLIFQFARRLSRCDFELLFFGQMDMIHTSLVIPYFVLRPEDYTCPSTTLSRSFFYLFALITATVSRQIASSSFVGITQTATLESSVEILTFSPRTLFRSSQSSMPR